jgi:hypothetical protein
VAGEVAAVAVGAVDAELALVPGLVAVEHVVVALAVVERVAELAGAGAVVVAVAAGRAVVAGE